MSQLFHDRLRDARAEGRGMLRVWGDAVLDVLVQAAREWGGRIRSGLRDFIVEGTKMGGWMQDLRFGVRSLARRPGFTAAAVATLALGIGATVAIFSVVNGVLLRPLPYPEPDRLVVVRPIDFATGEMFTTIDHPDVRTWQEHVDGIEIAAYSSANPTVTGFGAPEVVSAARVTDGFITFMGYQPTLGRDLTVADDDPEGARVIVVSHDFWTERFGRDPDALGRTVSVGGEPWEIVGVGPPDFDYPGVDLWMPRRHSSDSCGHGCRMLQAVGRLHPDVELERVQAGMDVVDARIAAEFPDAHTDIGTRLVPMLDHQVADVRTGLLVLFGAVGMVLLIACANVANLMLVRANQRRGEIGLRLSLGASRVRIVRQLLTESLLIAVLAGAVGMAVASWGTRALVGLAPGTLPRLAETGMDWTVIGFTAVTVLVVTSLFGLAPALQLAGSELRDQVSSGTRSAGRRNAGASRSFLVAGEVALSLTLLIGAGLLFRTLGEISRVDLGFTAESSERFRLSIPGSRYDSLQAAAFLDQLETRISDLPGVAGAGIGFGVPLSSGRIGTSIRLLDRPAVEPAQRPSMDIRPVSAGFLDASGTELVAGRWFTRDDVYGSEPVAVLNEAAVRRYYPNVDPIGRKIGVDVTWSFEETPDMTIVGVVEDVVSRAATEDPDPAVYMANAQFVATSVYVWIRLQNGVTTVIPQVRDLMAELDPELAMMNVTSLPDVVAAQQDTPRFYLTLLGVFSMVALLLAAIGLYGVVAYAVSQRKREIGIRIALGADGSRVVGMVVRQGLAPAVAGVVLGVMLSVFGGRALESLLFGVRPTDPVTLVSVAALLLLVTVGATLLPARRASTIPAAEALRAEG